MAIENPQDLLKKLLGKDAEPATHKDALWQPWIADKDHRDDPQGFVGIYRGYKLASKMVADRDGKGKERMSVFDLFAFDDCTPAPKEGTTWLVASSFKLEELKRIRPGTKVAIIFAGGEKNRHGGQTPDVAFYCENEAVLKAATLLQPLPPTNAEKVGAYLRANPAGEGGQAGGDDILF